tara:strand:- start:131 stop:277 length:147 start_codon:yes stop_codon:yes gene_type:complete
MDLTTLFLLILNLVILGLVAKWLYNRVKSKLDEVEERHRKRWSVEENE